MALFYLTVQRPNDRQTSRHSPTHHRITLNKQPTTTNSQEDGEASFVSSVSGYVSHSEVRGCVRVCEQRIVYLFGKRI